MGSSSGRCRHSIETAGCQGHLSEWDAWLAWLNRSDLAENDYSGHPEQSRELLLALGADPDPKKLRQQEVKVDPRAMRLGRKSSTPRCRAPRHFKTSSRSMR